MTITFSTQEHFKVEVKANGTPKTSGETFVVGAENVEISYAKEQIEWQVNFASGENYTMIVKVNNTQIESGTWLGQNEMIEILVTPADEYDLTEIKVNDENALLVDNKLSMPAKDITISAVVKMKTLTVADEGQNAIIIGEREALEDSKIEVEAIEETTERYTEIQSKINNLKSLKAFNIKLISTTTNEEISLTQESKILLALPENFDQQLGSLYRIDTELTKQEYTTETIDGKIYAVFMSNSLGTFAFVETQTPAQEGNNTWVIVLIVFAPTVVALASLAVAKGIKKVKVLKKEREIETRESKYSKFNKN